MSGYDKLDIPPKPDIFYEDALDLTPEEEKPGFEARMARITALLQLGDCPSLEELRWLLGYANNVRSNARYWREQATTLQQQCDDLVKTEDARLVAAQARARIEIEKLQEQVQNQERHIGALQRELAQYESGQHRLRAGLATQTGTICFCSRPATWSPPMWTGSTT